MSFYLYKQIALILVIFSGAGVVAVASLLFADLPSERLRQLFFLPLTTSRLLMFEGALAAAFLASSALYAAISTATPEWTNFSLRSFSPDGKVRYRSEDESVHVLGEDQRCRDRCTVVPEESFACIRMGNDPECVGRIEALRLLSTSDYAFNPPNTMVVGDSLTVMLIINTTGKANFADAMLETDRTRVAGNVKVAAQMEAELIGGAGFKVSALDRTRQDRSFYSNNSWQWSVSALQEGTNQLTLKIFVAVSSGGKKLGDEVAVADIRRVDVKVTDWQRVGIFAGQMGPIWTVMAATAAGLGAAMTWAWGAIAKLLRAASRKRKHSNRR